MSDRKQLPTRTGTLDSSTAREPPLEIRIVDVWQVQTQDAC